LLWLNFSRQQHFQCIIIFSSTVVIMFSGWVACACEWFLHHSKRINCL